MSNVKAHATMLLRKRALPLLCVAAGSLHAQPSSGADVWKGIAEEDLRRSFSIYENCPEPAKIAISLVESTALQNGAVRLVERWSLTGCNRERSYQVIFNPDLGTGLSYKSWPR